MASDYDKLLAQMKSQAPAVVDGRKHGLAATAEFVPDARYADHAWTDESAGYGLIGLVAGAGLVVAKKLGLVALLALFAKKGAVIIGAAGMAIAMGPPDVRRQGPRGQGQGPATLPAPTTALGPPDEPAPGAD